MENNFDVKNWYKEKFKELENKTTVDSKTYLHDFRKSALDNLLIADFPTQKNEEWKYTNISKIIKEKFIPAPLVDLPKLSIDTLGSRMFDIAESNLVVFYNGKYNKELSTAFEDKKYYCGSLNQIGANNENEIKNIIYQKNKNVTAFDYLSDGFASDGFVLLLPDNVQLEKPIQVLFINGLDSEKIYSSPKIFIKQGKSSQAEIILNFIGNAREEYFININTKIILSENSTLNLYKIQDEAEQAFHIDKTQIIQQANSTINHYNLSFGSKIYRMDLNAELTGENSECNYNGLYLGNENQLIDNHTFVNHAVANCRSNEIYKGILDDKSRGVFNGKILVERDAQKTNAYQSNKTILLSDKARIDTKPQLEIFADDVKCSHGATVGRLDENALFYIISRGIPSDIAKSMLIRAFANDVIEKINLNELREQLNHKIFQHLHRIEI